MKEAVTFSDEELDRISLEIQNNIVPVWLWIEQAVADIKLSLIALESSIKGISLSINKEKERKKIIESAFIMFARKAVLLSPVAANQLFNSILDDYNLEFLHSACTYLKSCCPEVQFVKKDKRIPDSIMQCRIDSKQILSFVIETNALSDTGTPESKIIKKSENNLKKQNMTHSMTTSLNERPVNMNENDNSLMAEVKIMDCPDSLRTIIENLLDIKMSLDEEVQNTVYVVKKVFTDSGLSTNIRTCQTEQEAAEFIRHIRKEYPELLKVCEFQIHAERINENKKTKHIKKET